MVRGGGGGFLLFLLYLLLGAYFLNIGFNFISLPDFFSKIDKWIIVAGGLFLILGAIYSLKVSNYNRIRYSRRRI